MSFARALDKSRLPLDLDEPAFCIFDAAQAKGNRLEPATGA
jgi:hypothetical protein